MRDNTSTRLKNLNRGENFGEIMGDRNALGTTEAACNLFSLTLAKIKSCFCIHKSHVKLPKLSYSGKPESVFGYHPPANPFSI